jgi:hypothetical protein
MAVTVVRGKPRIEATSVHDKMASGAGRTPALLGVGSFGTWNPEQETAYRTAGPSRSTVTFTSPGTAR